MSGVWNGIPRGLTMAACRSFPAALRYDYSNQADPPSVSLAAAPSADREGVILTATATTHGVLTRDLTFHEMAPFLGRDVFAPFNPTFAIADLTTPATYSVSLVDLFGRTAAGTLGETAPFPRDDSALTMMNVAIVVDVLAADVDLQGDAMSLSTSQPAQSGGHAISVQGGQLLVTPASGFTGSVALPYSVEDNDGARQAFIHLEVMDCRKRCPGRSGSGGVHGFRRAGKYSPGIQ